MIKKFLFILFLPLCLYAQMAKINLGKFVPIHKVRPDNIEEIKCQEENIYLLISFSTCCQQQRELEKNGIKFLQNLGDKTYIAFMKCQALDILSNYKLKGLQKIKPEYKITKKLYDWLNSENGPGTMDVSIFFFKNASESDKLTILENLDINFQKENNWYNAKIDKQKLLSLLNKEIIYHIKEIAPQTATFDKYQLDTSNVEERFGGVSDYEVRETYNLNGDGSIIGMWDGGRLYNHPDYEGRIQWMDSLLIKKSPHATHVAGILIGNGNNDSFAKGFGIFSDLKAWYFSNDLVKLSSNGLMDVTNHSYGLIIGWSREDDVGCENQPNWYFYDNQELFGCYTAESQSWDDYLFEESFETAVFAAGNDRDDIFNGPHHHEDNQCYNDQHPKDGDADGYDSLAGYRQVLKNNIVVASIAGIIEDPYPDGINTSDFSSAGPTDDGRIKPDFVAQGESVYSTWTTDMCGMFDPGDPPYCSLDGTSMAAPALSGVIALLKQHIRNLWGSGSSGTSMPSYAIKGLLAHTAHDIEFIGPDFKSGWGLVDARKAADFLWGIKNLDPSMHYDSFKLSNEGDFIDYPINLNNGQSLKVTISWNDPAGPPDSDCSNENDNYKALVNDLDIILISPSGQQKRKSWVPIRGGNALKGINSTDNVEQAVFDSQDIDNSGTWKVRIYAASLSQPQFFKLFISCNGECPYSSCNNVGEFSLLSPYNSQIVNPTNQITLNWSSSQNADIYDVYFGTTPNPPYFGSTENLSFQIDVSPGNTYYWKVKSRSTCNNSSYETAVWYFTVKQAQGSIIANANPNPVNKGQLTTINVTVKDSLGQPVPEGTSVTFSTSYPGIFSGNNCSSPYSPSTVLTDSNGQTWIRFTSDYVGTANILIESGNDHTNISINIVDPSANYKVEISVGYYEGTQEYSKYEINAIVTDTSGGPVSGQRVNFWASSGQLSETHGTTGPTGRAYTYLTIYSAREIAVTAVAGQASAATVFYGIIGTNSIPKIFPKHVLSFSTGGSVYGLDYSPDGKKLIAACEANEETKAWDPVNNYNILWNKYLNNNRPNQVSISPDGSNVLYVANDIEIRYASNGNYRCESSITGGSLGTFISNSSYIAATGTSLYKYSSLCGSGSLIYTLPSGHDFESEGHMDFNPAKNWIAACTGGGYLFIWDTKGDLIRQELVVASQNAYDCDFKADGKKIAAVGGRSIKVLDTSTWTGIYYTAIKTMNIIAVKYIDNDKKIAIGGYGTDGMIEIIDLINGASIAYADNLDGAVFEMAWNPINGDLAVGTKNGKVYIFKPLSPPDINPPIISISYPSDNLTTTNPILNTNGIVTDESAIISFKINNSPVQLNQDGSFSYNINLQNGLNTITYFASDLPGNIRTETRNVTLITDNNGPIISNISVTPGQGIKGTIFTIKCNASDDYSGISYVKSIIKDNSGQTIEIISMFTENGITYYGNFNSSNANIGTYFIDIEAKDSMDNITLIQNSVSFNVICGAYSIDPKNQLIPADGGSFNFTITATSGCSWTTQESDSWITITSGSFGSGNGSGSYSVPANSGTSSRTGYIYLRDSSGTTVDTLTITQEGAPNTCQQELGDVNMNGNITNYDASLILQYVVGQITLNPDQICRADVNENSNVTSMDVSYTLQCVVGSNCSNLPPNFLLSCQNHGHCQ